MIDQATFESALRTSLFIHNLAEQVRKYGFLPVSLADDKKKAVYYDDISSSLIAKKADFSRAEHRIIRNVDMSAKRPDILSYYEGEDYHMAGDPAVVYELKRERIISSYIELPFETMSIIILGDGTVRCD